MTIYSVRINPYQVHNQPETDDPVIYLFSERQQADSFCNHLRDLYLIDVNVGIYEIYTYDEAISDFVEMFGPSEE